MVRGGEGRVGEGRKSFTRWVVIYYLFSLLMHTSQNFYLFLEALQAV